MRLRWSWWPCVQIRYFAPCNDGNCDWVESDTQLQNGRWYASNQILPDGSQIVVGGRSVQTVEYVPANGRGTFYLDLLATVLIMCWTFLTICEFAETRDSEIQNWPCLMMMILASQLDLPVLTNYWRSCDFHESVTVWDPGSLSVLAPTFACERGGWWVQWTVEGRK